MPVYSSLVEKKRNGQKSLAVLIDPDHVNTARLEELADVSAQAKVDYLFVGGSLVVSNHLDLCVRTLKDCCNIPVVLFPGSPSQISVHADALLYLSLISGRNADMLIGQHVISAPLVKKSGLEIISTGYMVIDGGVATTVSYITNASPIPSDKPDISMCTAIAGEMLGMKVIYMDSGSGAQKAVSEEMIQTVSHNLQIPLIVGGGIRTPEKAYNNCRAGADVVVVGNAFEKDVQLIAEMAAAVHTSPLLVS